MRAFKLTAAVLTAAFALAGAAQAANLVANPGFEAPPNAPTSGTYLFSGGVSAAPDWNLFNNTPTSTSTEVISSTLSGGGAQMLHVNTAGGDNGVFQFFSGLAQYANARVFVLSGTVGLYLYSNPPATPIQVQQGTAFSSTLNSWQTLSLNTGSALSNEIVLYSFGGGANFYVDNVYASDVAEPAPPTGGVPEPSAWALMILGFGAAGAMLRRRHAATA